MLKIGHIYKNSIDNKYYVVLEKYSKKDKIFYCFLRFSKNEPNSIEYHEFVGSTFINHMVDITETYQMPKWFSLIVNLPMNFEE